MRGEEIEKKKTAAGADGCPREKVGSAFAARFCSCFLQTQFEILRALTIINENTDADFFNIFGLAEDNMRKRGAGVVDVAVQLREADRPHFDRMKAKKGDNPDNTRRTNLATLFFFSVLLRR